MAMDHSKPDSGKEREAKCGLSSVTALRPRTIKRTAQQSIAAIDAAPIHGGQMISTVATKGIGFQRRRARACEFTPEKQERFFEVLGDTANLTAAAAAAGVSRMTISNWRRKDAAFARRWAATLEEGYALLEMHLLGMALFGTHIESESQTDAKGVRRAKVRRQDGAMALRVAVAHQHEVAHIRDKAAQEAEAARHAEVPDMEETLDELVERLRARLTKIERKSIKAREAVASDAR
jgi:transcriptional regulator with XRE-family HTH domain